MSKILVVDDEPSIVDVLTYNLTKAGMGNRMLVSVRFQRADEQGRLLPCNDDLNFEMSLCT